MKDNLFAMLMNFFEQSLSRISAQNTEQMSAASAEEDYAEINPLWCQDMREDSTRIFSPYELYRLTKASYQFLVRMEQLKVIHPRDMELIIHDLCVSESPYVTLKETKWTIRNRLAKNINEEQLAFLDLVLYQKEDKISRH